MAATPFFLERGAQRLFCMHYPHAGPVCRGGVLFAPPFGEEMNKSRRVMALLARRLSALGWQVLQLDLSGCGDSGGELAEARWSDWQADLDAGAAWLAERCAAPLHVLGVRLGALLALQLAARPAPVPPLAGVVLWQPVLSGETYLTGLLRLRLAGDMLDAGAARESGGSAALRAALRQGRTLEVAGYALSAGLAQDLGALDAASLAPACPLTWFELASGADKPLSPGAAKMLARWQEQGTQASAHVVQAAPFWNAPEIEECPALLAATCALFGESS